VIAFEAKFTEADGGPCSQTAPVRAGANAGKRQCDGSYRKQVNPVNGVSSMCALTGKGIGYWERVPQVMNVDPLRDYTPCPFAGGWYQWMRNLVSAHTLGREKDVPAAFIVVYADGDFPMVSKVTTAAWKELEQAVEGRAVPLRCASYQELLWLAIGSATPADRAVLKELKRWMQRKMAEAAKLRRWARWQQ